MTEQAAARAVRRERDAPEMAATYSRQPVVAREPLVHERIVRVEQHRRNPVCASCHNIMDPLGFSLENFDLVGTWREFDGPAPIDTSGKLADGTPLHGPADLRRALLSRSDAFMATATEKLMIYALGRPVHYYDMPNVRAIVRRAAADNNRFSALLLGIVESDPFQKRIKK